jgi:hypothetical protein
MSHTIEADVKHVNAKTKESNQENRDGSPQATRKNPHVIDAGFEQDLPVSYWYIMWMEISIMLT